MSDTLSDLLSTLAEHVATHGPRATRLGPVGGSAPARLLAELRGAAGGRGVIEERALLGEGGMGQVTLASQQAVGRDVAIKRVRPEVRDDRTTLRLLQEGWVTGMLEHPNIVPVHDIAVDAEGVPFLVLKRIGGSAWAEYIHDPELLAERFAPADALEWHLRVLLDVCDAIAFAHSRSVLHRDLKPDNVMVGRFGEVLVMDWGLAVTVDPDGDDRLPRMRDGDGAVGTPAYMAPEMLPQRGAPPVGVRTDVYLLGACLHEVITGQPPHTAKDPAGLLREILGVPLVFPDPAPPELVAICRRALAVEPRERFSDVASLSTALRDFLQHRSSALTAAHAQAGARDLLERLADASVDAEMVREKLGAVRFGFRYALESWGGNEPARRGLIEVAEAVARWELERGDAHAAARCLAEVEGVDPSLMIRVRSAVDEANDRLEAAAAWARRQDRIRGLGPRRAAMLWMGAAVSLTPLSYGWIEQVTYGGPHHMLSFIACGGVLLAAVAFVALMRWWGGPFTDVTRSVAQAVLAAPLAETAVTVGGVMMGLEPRPTQVLFLLLWATIAAVLALRLDARLWLGAAGYGVGFFAAAAWPDHLFQILALANGIQTIAALWTWGRR